jgi:hypothetical protein
MVTYVCPGCSRQVTARNPVYVAHECPQRRNRITAFKPVSGGVSSPPIAAGANRADTPPDTTKGGK